MDLCDITRTACKFLNLAVYMVSSCGKVLVARVSEMGLVRATSVAWQGRRTRSASTINQARQCADDSSATADCARGDDLDRATNASNRTAANAHVTCIGLTTSESPWLHHRSN